jgi:hypothetical protein
MPIVGDGEPGRVQTPIRCSDRLAALFNLPPREATRPVRQPLAFPHMLDPTGRRAEHVQFLVVSGRRCVRAGLVLLPFGHACM